MDTLCATVSGLLMIIAGFAPLLAVGGMLNGNLAEVIEGAAIALFGLSFIVHGMGACPLCKGPPEEKKGK